jgi:ABC-type nitrate/sulfonate/bicarbonate transport system ATPase subunit
MKEVTIDIALKRFASAGSAPPVVALRDLRFSVKPGEFVCVLGPSGCGKTTLLNIIAGLDSDFSGEVNGGGKPGMASPVIGYVFQTPRLLPWRTVAENIQLALRPGQDAGIVDELLAMTGLSEFRDTFPERLSVGMSRRVALVRAFAVEPDLLLMDEPFVSLDEATAQRLRQMLLDIWQRRPTTVLFVTHDTREAVLLADNIVRLTASPGTVDRIITVDVPRQQRNDSAIIESWRALNLREA